MLPAAQQGSGASPPAAYLVPSATQPDPDRRRADSRAFVFFPIFKNKADASRRKVSFELF